MRGRLRFANDQGLNQELVVELAEGDVQLLRSFQVEARRLLGTRFCQEGANVNLQMHWEEGKGLSYKVDLPPWEDFVVALHCLRPLILKKEPSSFLRMKSLVSRHLKDAPVRPLLAFLGHQYSGRRMQEAIRIQSNDVLMNSEEMLFTWLNAHEYHRDLEKQAFLETLHKILPLEWSQGIFVFLVMEKVKAIGNLLQLTDLVLGDRDSLQVNI
jgi:hypothetical protein